MRTDLNGRRADGRADAPQIRAPRIAFDLAGGNDRRLYGVFCEHCGYRRAKLSGDDKNRAQIPGLSFGVSGDLLRQRRALALELVVLRQ